MHIRASIRRQPRGDAMTYLAARNLITGGAFGGAMGAAMLGLGAPTRPAALALGTRIGNFSISEEIGRGGSGIVYRAQRCDGAFAQTVALKIAHATSETRLRAKAERATLAQMQHPFIASIFDGGETPDGDIWFAMDLING